MQKLIQLQKTGYDSFIDVLKGFSILFVLLNHSLPFYFKKGILFCLWGELAVPTFLLIQVYHYFRRGKKKTNIVTLCKRIFLPFLTAQLIVFFISIFVNNDIHRVLTNVCKSGGLGPGEYYIWIYIQFLILLPLFKLLSNKFNGYKLTILMIIVSQILEICSQLYVSPGLYKLLSFRYIFLLYLGLLWYKEGILINNTRIFLSLISVAFILVMYYSDVDLAPYFYCQSWRMFHWIAYFYVAFLAPFVFMWIYECLGVKLQKILRYIGANSWSIFCMQIVVFSFLSPSDFKVIDNLLFRDVLYFVSAIILSLLPPLVYSSLKEKL